MQDIGIVGLWHLGCVLGASWAKLGHRVYGVDVRAPIVEGLQKGQPPLYEPGLEETLRQCASRGLVSFSSGYETLRTADAVFIAYDTPVDEQDVSDPSILEESISGIAQVLKDGALVVMSSQTPAGFCVAMRARLQAVNPTVELVSSPENLRLGEAIACYLEPGRIIVGGETDEALSRARTLFSEIPGEIVTMGLTSAEMVKHGINAFLATCVTFSNHLADLCEVSGADILDVVRGMKTDPRIGTKSYLSPGIGFSGGTLGRDLRTLDGLNGLDVHGTATFFGEVYRLNQARKVSVMEKAAGFLGGEVAGKRVGVLGLTYKPGTSTLRRSLPLEIVDLLQQQGAQIVAFDPKADFSELDAAPTFQIGANAADVFRDADLVVLLTEWPEFKSLDWDALLPTMRRPVVFDTKNALAQTALARRADAYRGMGR